MIVSPTFSSEQNKNAPKPISDAHSGDIPNPHPDMSIRATMRLVVKYRFLQQDHHADTANGYPVILQQLVGQLPPLSRGKKRSKNQSPAGFSEHPLLTLLFYSRQYFQTTQALLKMWLYENYH
jgi:hypothetical protein